MLLSFIFRHYKLNPTEFEELKQNKKWVFITWGSLGFPSKNTFAVSAATEDEEFGLSVLEMPNVLGCLVTPLTSLAHIESIQTCKTTGSIFNDDFDSDPVTQTPLSDERFSSFI